MNKIILAIFIFTSCFLKAQFPYLVNPCTVTPTSPDNNSNVQIITKVYAVTGGLTVTDKSQSINTTLKTIELRGCYWAGVTANTSTVVSTYTIGTLPPGVYTYTFKCVANAAFSPTMACAPGDSSNVTGTFTVDLANGIKQNAIAPLLVITPNPFSDHIKVSGMAENVLNIEVADYTGRIVLYVEAPSSDKVIDLSSLSKGFYYFRIRTPRGENTFKMLKE